MSKGKQSTVILQLECSNCKSLQAIMKAYSLLVCLFHSYDWTSVCISANICVINSTTLKKRKEKLYCHYQQQHFVLLEQQLVL